MDFSLSEEQVRDFCSERLARYKVPKYFRFAESLPVNAQGKLQKNEIRQLYDPGLQ